MERSLRFLAKVPPGPLAAAAAIAGLWLMSTSPNAAARVPRLTGLPVNDAIAQAASDGYFPRVVLRHRGGVAGTVVSQAPQAGLIRDRRTEIVLTVTRGVAQIPVPDVRGLSVDEARVQIDRNNLTPGDVTYERVANARADRVVRTVPASGTYVDVGTRVDVVAAS